MKPTKIISRRKVKLDSGDWSWLFETDAGDYLTHELAKIKGILPTTILNRCNRIGRISKLGISDPKILAPGRLPPGKAKNASYGNDEWFSLSGKPRKDPEEVVIGEYERSLPDNFDEEKAQKFDRERQRNELVSA